MLPRHNNNDSLNATSVPIASIQSLTDDMNLKISDYRQSEPLLTSYRNNRDSISRQLNLWLSIAGFKSAHHLYFGFVLFYLLMNSFINAVLIRHRQSCLFLSLTVFCFQLESLILYCFGIFILSTSFKQHFVDILCHEYLSKLNYNAKHLYVCVL